MFHFTQRFESANREFIEITDKIKNFIVHRHNKLRSELASGKVVNLTTNVVPYDMLEVVNKDKHFKEISFCIQKINSTHLILL